MEQKQIQVPEVTDARDVSILRSVYLHTGAMLLRNLVWMLSGNGQNFDDFIKVKTPGLGTRQARCGICRPRRSGASQDDKAKPLVLIFEGGGFILGRPEDGERNCRMISDETGAIVISVDYAKAPRHPYPQALLQTYAVLKWALSDEAKAYGINIDPARVALLGNSAGGNLVATLSLLVSFTEGPCARFRQDLGKDFRLVSQVLLYPSTENHELYGTRYMRASPEVQAQSLPIAVAELMEEAYLPPPIRKDQIFVSPLTAHPSILKAVRLPPALILIAGMDCLKTEAEMYGEKLAQGGVFVEIKEYPLAIHGFSHYKKGKNYRQDDIEDCWQRICGILIKAFKQA